MADEGGWEKFANRDGKYYAYMHFCLEVVQEMDSLLTWIVPKYPHFKCGTAQRATYGIWDFNLRQQDQETDVQPNRTLHRQLARFVKFRA